MNGQAAVHLEQVAKALTAGRLVPFLGAGACLCDRPEDLEWQPGQREYLPLGGELAGYLANAFRYGAEGESDLARVSQRVALLDGTGPLYEELHALFDADYSVPSLHRLLAALPAALRDKGYPRTADPLRQHFLVATTNYDDLLERAFREAGQPFHAVVYEADGENKGTFFHRLPDGGSQRIDSPNDYRGLVADERRLPILLKIHGTVDRSTSERDSFVITEDHYIEYLTRTDATSLIPAPLPAMLRNSHLLFLGYGLKDWNLRVILHRLWGERKLSWKSWAIQRDPDPLDRTFWDKRDVEILEAPLGEYTTLLEQRVRELPPAQAPS
jgi:SIR2-like domain